jgi:hypothetical protein
LSERQSEGEEKEWSGIWRVRERRTQLESFKIIWILSNSIAVFFTQN